MCLNEHEYLCSESEHKVKENITDNLLKSGKLSGFYYGSSTRLPCGEIWDPFNGHHTLMVTIQIMTPGDDIWQTIFEQNIDFAQKSILKNLEDFKLYQINEKEQAEKKNREPDYEKIIKIRDENAELINCGKLCMFHSMTNLKLQNEKYKVTLFFRDLYKFDNIVQISGFNYSEIIEDTLAIKE